VGGLAETLLAPQEQQITAARRLAIIPALNEELSVASVIAEIRELDPEFEILVIDDGSKDGTFAEASRAGASVVSLPYNLGIGGAVQTGYQYARDNGFDVAVQWTATASTIRATFRRCSSRSSRARRTW
jgi:cellulose synthase/poly-beta-1,6-N-acetylglucosamine synthase-like glycosyltransferase